MILMGDEMRRSQQGNNNSYCHDNELSWLDWNLLTKHADLHRFVRLLNSRRLLRATGPEQERRCLSQLIQEANKSWHGVRLNQPDWRDDSHSLALMVEVRKQQLLVYLILNAYWESLNFELPPLGVGEQWCRWIDTTLESPEDIAEWEKAGPCFAPVYKVGPRSTVVLFAHKRDDA
jgi:isoamylase